MKYQPLVAEFLGTLVLTLVVFIALGSAFVVPVPVLAGLTLGLMVYILGPVSGAHCNPAVTIGMWALKKMGTQDALWYVVVQILGGFVAGFVGFVLLGDTVIAIPTDTVMVGIAEGIGALLLVMAVASVTLKKTPDAASGLSIGTALTLGAHVAASQGNGIINPAVALGIGSLSWAYVLGPIAGGFVAAWLYRWLLGR